MAASTPFVNSQPYQDDSFGSLQLSGNLPASHNSDSPPSINLDQSPTLNKISQSDVDIFNPGKSIIESSKSTCTLSTDSNNTPEMGIGLQFELSQDFSQHPQQALAQEEKSDNTQPLKSQEPQRTKIRVRESEETHRHGHEKDLCSTKSVPNVDKDISKPRENEKEDCTQQKDASKLPQNILSPKTTKFDLIKKVMKDNDISNSDLRKYLSKPKNEEKEPIFNKIFKGKHCFAKWHDYFFAADVKDFDEEIDNISVEFEDKESAECSSNDICMKTEFESGQDVHVQTDTGEFMVGKIHLNTRMNGELMYLCVAKNRNYIVSRYQLRFLKEHLFPASKRKQGDTSSSSSNKGGNKTKKRRMTDLQKRKMEESTPSSEEIVSPTLNKKKTQNQQIPIQLFSNYIFMITKGKTTPQNKNLTKKETSTSDDNSKRNATLESDLVSEKGKNEATESQETEEEEDSQTTISDEAEDVPLFNEQEAVQSVLNEGGVYTDKLSACDLEKSSYRVCITDLTDPTSDNCSFKFLYCISRGIPIVHYDWLIESVKQRKVMNFHSYLVFAGRDITGERIQQYIMEREKFPYTPLNGTRIHVHLGEVLRYNSREVTFVLQKIGCDVHTTQQVTKRSRKIAFDLDSVHFILTLSEDVPKLLLETCSEMKKEILTFEWLRQCVINNKLLDVVDSPLFRYSVNIE
eukprot:TCONS_00031331-protein